MEQMGYAGAALSALLYGLLAGIPIGIAIAVVCRNFRIRAIWVSVVTTLVAFAGVVGAQLVVSAQQIITTSDMIRNILWANFVMIALVVIVGIQWFVWLLEVVALIYWKRKYGNTNPQSTP